MEPKIVWRCLDDNMLVQNTDQDIIPGKKSYEKKNQAFRESIYEEIIYPSKDW